MGRLGDLMERDMELRHQHQQQQPAIDPEEFNELKDQVKGLDSKLDQILAKFN